MRMHVAVRIISGGACDLLFGCEIGDQLRMKTDIRLKKVLPEQFKDLAVLAHRLWHMAFHDLLTLSQVDYMIEKFQSEAAFVQQTAKESYEYFYIMTQDEEIAGYTAIAARPNEDRLFLSKLYLAPELQGRGYATSALKEIATIAANRGCRSVYLTVNKQNQHAIAVYEKFGFARTDAVVTDIGNGYQMDDYIYEYLV